jgi:hypothetical protein
MVNGAEEEEEEEEEKDCHWCCYEELTSLLAMLNFFFSEPGLSL